MVSPRRSASPITEEPRWDNNMSLPAKSCESLYSASSRESASQIYQRKQPQRGMKASNGLRQPSMVNNKATSDIHQRVMSARNLRVKTFQNQLADAQAEISNLAHENRMLRTMHKRQSMALNKYENTGAELPQLLHSHAEELRVWQTKHRNVQAANKELEQKLKQKEQQILTLSDQNRHFSQLIRDKNLDERQKLQDKLRVLEQRLQEKDNDMKLMARKVQLESKNFRQQLLNEQKKCKEVMLKLEKAKLEISGYRKLEEFTIDKSNPLSASRRTKLNAVEETDKIEKLEKSLEMLDKAIEKNNQSEFNALTDVLDTDSNFDFEKDDDEEKNAIQASEGPDNKDNKPIRAKLTLPPANNQFKPLSSAQSNASRPSLGQSLIPSKLNSSKSNSRQRTGAGGGGGGGGFGGSITTLASSNARSSLPGKRRESEAPSSKHTPAAATASAADTAAEKLEALAKTLEYDYEEDSERDEDEDSDDKKYGKMDEEDDAASDEEENQNNGQDEYVSYLDTKCELVEMLEMDEEYEDDDDDLQSPQPPSKAVQKLNLRAPNMKENMAGIRKLISDDYKERENFLDIHCRPTSGSNSRDDPGKKKRPGHAAGAPAAGQLVASRKHALLAALKVIDDNKDED
ncbi:PREDICTED: lebercilin isoform X2 [Drosophila arizonae]|uniref:Lebercilin isoform X2 n=1 Tax=Drosophila arizonae TaxID=7263 RepID=A0ABM1P5W3_DROAR|nr:PREDICTED: lebercilin isoform X2 [Drosophila arizonae]